MAEPTGDAAQEPTTKKPSRAASSAAGGVPPVEPKPATPRKRASSEQPEMSAPIPPLVDLTGNGSEAPPRPDPYAAPAANPYAPPAANPYVQNSAAPQYGSPQYGAPQYGGQPYQYGAPTGQPKGLAITSMILGIVSLMCCWIGVLAIAAVITGHIAQRSQPYARGFWLTGLITGYVGLGITVAYWIFVVISAVGSSIYDYSY